MLYLLHDIVLYIIEQILLLLHNDYTFFLEGHLPAKPNKIQILMMKNNSSFNDEKNYEFDKNICYFET